MFFKVHYILSSLFGNILEFFLGKLFLKGKKESRAWTPIIPIFRRLRQENTEIAWDTVSKRRLTGREEQIQRSGHHLKNKKNPRNTFKAIIKDTLLTDHQNLDLWVPFMEPWVNSIVSNRLLWKIYELQKEYTRNISHFYHSLMPKIACFHS